MKTYNVDINELPTVGKLRWKQFAKFLPVSRETWRKLSHEGKAPPPIRFSVRCTMWDAGEVRRWISDPMGYIAPKLRDATKGASDAA